MAHIGKEDEPIIVVPDETDAPITTPEREPATTRS